MNKFSLMALVLLFSAIVGCASDMDDQDNGDAAIVLGDDGDVTQIDVPIDIPAIELPGGDDAQSPTAPPAWQPSDVHLTCSSGYCPPGVGVVIFVENLSDAMILGRCTATLIKTDRVLTNGHCDQGRDFTPDQGYFFNLENGVTYVYPLGSRVYDRLDGQPNGGDLAVFALNSPDLRSLPRNVSRSIPADMSELVGFQVNDTYEGSQDTSIQFKNLTIDTIHCATTAQDSSTGGGVNNLSIALDLMGCPLSTSSSGAPLFSLTDPLNIQVVANTGELAVGSAVFGLGNRVQCMNIPGVAVPQVTCQPPGEGPTSGPLQNSLSI